MQSSHTQQEESASNLGAFYSTLHSIHNLFSHYKNTYKTNRYHNVRKVTLFPPQQHLLGLCPTCSERKITTGTLVSIIATVNTVTLHKLSWHCFCQAGSVFPLFLQDNGHSCPFVSLERSWQCVAQDLKSIQQLNMQDLTKYGFDSENLGFHLWRVDVRHCMSEIKSQYARMTLGPKSRNPLISLFCPNGSPKVWDSYVVNACVCVCLCVRESTNRAKWRLPPWYFVVHFITKTLPRRQCCKCAEHAVGCECAWVCTCVSRRALCLERGGKRGGEMADFAPPKQNLKKKIK